jgi:hypothetical protein
MERKWRGVRIPIALHENADLTSLPHGLLGRCDRARPTDNHRHHDAGEQHEIADRHDDESIGREFKLAVRFGGGRTTGVGGKEGLAMM